MKRQLRLLAPVTAAAVLAAAGCGAARPPATAPAPGAPPTLATSIVTPAGAWAVAVMGGSAASHNNFWQLFARPPGAAGWRLVTPPGVASNGGLVIAPGGRSLTAAFRPSQRLVFTPLAVTSDDGASWSSAVLDAPLANVPDALAAAPGSARLLALLTDGTVEMSGSGATWATLASRRSLAASADGARCGLQQLTAAAFSTAGAVLLAGACSRPGRAGIFAATGSTWRLTGPVLPPGLARQPVTVLRLTSTGTCLVALLQTGTGPAASLLAAWSADGGSHWDLSAPFPLGTAGVAAASFGPGDAAAVVLGGNRGMAVAGAGQPWRPVPALPPGTATLASGPGAALEALAVHGRRLTVWRPGAGDTGWTQVQAITVPIQYGSSG